MQPMNRDDLRERTKQFALRIIRLYRALPKNTEGDVVGRQLLRSGTSIGANYREALRVSSRKHFLSTLHICLREADESLYWLELITESGIVPKEKMAGLLDECSQLVAIFTSTVASTRRKQTTTEAKFKPR